MPTGYKTYTVKPGQSIYDVCLNTYGSIDLLLKLMRDNGITSAAPLASGQIISYDPKLVVSQSLQAKNFVFATANEIGVGQFEGAYITEDSNYNSSATFYVSSDGAGNIYIP